MLAETFEERLQWIDPNHYERSSQFVTVRETAKEGEAEIVFRVANDTLRINLSEDNRLNYLKQKKVADAVIFEFISEHAVRIHIIECKSTVKRNEWEHIKEQFTGAVINAVAMLGVLGFQEQDIQETLFYTAYRKEKLSIDNNPNPGQLKHPVGKSSRPSAYEATHEWMNGRISILSLAHARHYKIPLDEKGKPVQPVAI